MFIPGGIPSVDQAIYERWLNGKSTDTVYLSEQYAKEHSWHKLKRYGHLLGTSRVKVIKTAAVGNR